MTCGYYIPTEPYGVLEMSGHDAVDFMQRMTSNDLIELQRQNGIRSVLLTEKARIVDLLTILQEESTLRIVTSPGNAETVLRWLRKFIVMEDIRLTLAAEPLQSIEVWCSDGSESSYSQLVESLHVEGQHSTITIGNCRVIAICLWQANREGKAIPLIVLLLCLLRDVEQVCSWLQSNGIHPIDHTKRELLRINAGIGQYPNEFNDGYVPYEAGLGRYVKLGKGCFIGQEVLERLVVQKKLRWALYSFISEDEDNTTTEGTPIYVYRQDNPASLEEMGVITSVVVEPKQGLPSHNVHGLCYIRFQHRREDRYVTAHGKRLYLGRQIGTLE